ncbi:AMP-binding protein [Erwinia typographi]|uniref:AMP-binding protein n=1 Tax=Erwinia typographi TaxID=371042 RepID=A0A0A4A2P9_9GAMM|nr:class I adenylate-forming enzyme family protein [Erwinia typographi]KGT92218.1 AMP-binding protein [Erwinia typographi]
MITLSRLNEIAALHGNQICITDDNRKYTWNEIVRETESRVVFLHRAFNEEHLRSACYLSKNSAELVCWLAAFATLGISASGLDYSLPVGTLSALIGRIRPGLLLISYSLFTPDELSNLNTSGTSMLPIDSPTDPVIRDIGELHLPELDNLLSTRTTPPPPFRAVSLTSGTSSVPKIALRYRSFDARRFAWFTRRFGFSDADGFMLILPLYHAAGNSWARMFMGLGAPLYLVDQDDESALERTLATDNVRATVMTPNLVVRMTGLASRKAFCHHLRWVLVGGSYFPMKNKLVARAAFGDIFYEYYGCTETGVNVLSEPTDLLACPASVGRPFDGNRVMILDEGNRPLGTGAKGRVAISSYMLMDEYGDGSRPFITIGDERYFLMADYGYLDDSGRLFLMNRNGEIRDTHDVYRIEENIRSLPCITDVALVTVQLQGENHVRCIFSTDQYSKEKFIRLIEKINEQVAKNGVIHFSAHRVDKIPYSPSGKVRFGEIIRILEAA